MWCTVIQAGSVVTAQLALTRWKPPSARGREKWWRENLRGKVEGGRGKRGRRKGKNVVLKKLGTYAAAKFVKTQRH